jgi:hypothetical protein
MKTKLTLFVAVLFANCLLAVELPQGVNKDSKDPLVQAFIKTNGDIINAALIVRDDVKPIFDARGRVTRLHLNDRGGLTDDALKLLVNIPTLEALYISGANITDNGLLSLIKLKNLTELHIASCPVTDAGFRDFHKLSNLRTVVMYGCNKVTNEGMRHLSKSPKLANISINGCSKIDGAGLNHLLNLIKPNSIEAAGTGISSKDASDYMKRKPSAKVFLK